MINNSIYRKKFKYLIKKHIREIIGLIVGLFIGLAIIIILVLPKAFDFNSFSFGLFWGIMLIIIIEVFVFLFSKVTFIQEKENDNKKINQNKTWDLTN
ncbi:MAG: hypothetical protein JXA99_00455 [Candidatus Lokiarchaeota archaeon]|nr:hypothetical protein [Candidatus Lokiarchaeota archaeon]